MRSDFTTEGTEDTEDEEWMTEGTGWGGLTLPNS